jgi:hypothetical protein
MKPSERAAELAKLEWEELVEMRDTGMDPDVSMRHVLMVLDEVVGKVQLRAAERTESKQVRCGRVGHVFGRGGRCCVYCGVRHE